MNNLNKLLKLLNIKSNYLFSLTDSKISINNVNFADEIFLNDKSEVSGNQFKNVKGFINDLEVIRLNHIGVGYGTDNIDNEVKKLSKTLKYNLYEEGNNYKKSRWLFTGDNGVNPIKTMFEIVLFETKSKTPTKWKPHFQIDYDTNSSYEDIIKLSHKHFGKNIFTWKIDIKDYGVVLTMGEVCKIGDVKIHLGIGTKLRDTYYQRSQFLNIG